MPSLTRTRSHSKSIASMKTTRSGCTQGECWMLSMHGSFTPLVFTTTGGMGKECIRYHSRLAELIATKKGEQYSQPISWIQAWISFALLRSALGPVSRKSRELFGPEKPFVRVRPAYSVKLVFSYVVKGIKIKIIAKFRASRRLRFEDTKRIMSPEIHPNTPEKFRDFRETGPWFAFENRG